MPEKTKLLIFVDGGSRGNPGPAACAAVLKTADDGQTVLEEGEFIGRATNNVAEYHGLLLGLRLAKELKADDIEICSDSELLVFQLTGQYRVKNAKLKPLHEMAQDALAPFRSVQIRHVPREMNLEADRLVHETVRKHLKTHGQPFAHSPAPPSVKAK